MWRLLGQGSNLLHSSDSNHRSNYTGSLPTRSPGNSLSPDFSVLTENNQNKPKKSHCVGHTNIACVLGSAQRLPTGLSPLDFVLLENSSWGARSPYPDRSLWKSTGAPGEGRPANEVWPKPTPAAARAREVQGQREVVA